MQEIADLIMNNGLSVVLVGYFIFKDWKFNEQIINTLSSIREVLSELKTFHKIEGE